MTRGKMIVISNHVSEIGMDYPESSIIRVNVAWLKSKEEADELLESLEGQRIWFDYPTGRTKPPKPKFSLQEAVEFTKKYGVEYFAFSNAENGDFIKGLRSSVPENVKLVPKVETKKGIENLREILSSAKTDVIMLDKEDLYVDVGCDSDEFERLVSDCKEKCKELNATCLELKGVVFGHD
jgi:citrate lyase beta subunit